MLPDTITELKQLPIDHLFIAFKEAETVYEKRKAAQKEQQRKAQAAEAKRKRRK